MSVLRVISTLFYLLLVGIIRETDVKHQCNKVYNGVIAVGLKKRYDHAYKVITISIII
jgi:hypothetical protein